MISLHIFKGGMCICHRYFDAHGNYYAKEDPNAIQDTWLEDVDWARVRERREGRREGGKGEGERGGREGGKEGGREREEVGREGRREGERERREGERERERREGIKPILLFLKVEEQRQWREGEMKGNKEDDEEEEEETVDKILIYQQIINILKPGETVVKV